MKLKNGSQVAARPARTPTVGSPGYFSESNDNGAPSYPGQDWFNDVIDEMSNALTEAGVAYDSSKLTNLATAFVKLKEYSASKADTAQGVATEQANEMQLNLISKLSGIPIFPEVLTEDNRLSVTLDGTDLSVSDDEVIRMFGWLDVNTSDYPDKSFSVDLTKTYHLRFDLENGFRLIDLEDLTYNPDQVDHFSAEFDATYSDVLLAVLNAGVLTVYRNVTSIKSGQAAYFETTVSYALANAVEEVMSLAHENEFSRAVDVKLESRAIYSSTSTEIYGSSDLLVDGVSVDWLGRLHVGTAGGYSYNRIMQHRYFFKMLRKPYSFSVLYRKENGVPYFNVKAAHSGWDAYSTFSYIALEVA